jgi:PAS domain S-box-containing protein
MPEDARRPGLDPTEQLAIEQGRAQLALTAAGMGEFEWDVVGDRFIVSPRMAEITGLPVGAMPAESGQASYRFVHADDVEELSRVISRELFDHGRYEVRYRMIRPDDGRMLWMYSAGVAVPGPTGVSQRVIGVVRDISERKAREDERDALVAELDHRVKNVLASVKSLASQSARKTVSLDAFLKTFSGRLDAMAAAHALLTSTRWRGADIGHIAAAELAGLALGRARWGGPEIVLNPRATNALTLALHELATNALKYGALASDAGRIDVDWRLRAGGGFELSWTERGGPPVTPPSRCGFGLTLIQQVTGRELGGNARLEFPPDGVRATFEASDTALATCGVSALASAPSAPRIVESAGELTVADDVAGIRVLIVEDSVLLALELEAGLSEAGASVVGVAADIDEAARMLPLDFEVAVLDANLNGRSVTPIAEALVARGIPFIFATGYGDADPTPPGFGVPVVRKPYNIRQIAVALVEALGSR